MVRSAGLIDAAHDRGGFRHGVDERGLVARKRLDAIGHARVRAASATAAKQSDAALAAVLLIARTRASADRASHAPGFSRQARRIVRTWRASPRWCARAPPASRRGDRQARRRAQQVVQAGDRDAGVGGGAAQFRDCAGDSRVGSSLKVNGAGLKPVITERGRQSRIAARTATRRSPHCRARCACQLERRSFGDSHRAVTETAHASPCTASSLLIRAAARSGSCSTRALSARRNSSARCSSERALSCPPIIRK